MLNLLRSMLLGTISVWTAAVRLARTASLWRYEQWLERKKASHEGVRFQVRIQDPGLWSRGLICPEGEQWVRLLSSEPLRFSLLNMLAHGH